MINTARRGIMGRAESEPGENARRGRRRGGRLGIALVVVVVRCGGGAEQRWTERAVGSYNMDMAMTAGWDDIVAVGEEGTGGRVGKGAV